MLSVSRIDHFTDVWGGLHIHGQFVMAICLCHIPICHLQYFRLLLFILGSLYTRNIIRFIGSFTSSFGGVFPYKSGNGSTGTDYCHGGIIGGTTTIFYTEKIDLTYLLIMLRPFSAKPGTPQSSWLYFSLQAWISNAHFA